MKTASNVRCIVAAALAALAALQASAQAPTTAPVIVTQPASQTVTAGARVTLDVTATGAVAYRWFKEGRLLSNKPTSALVIESAKAEDTGSYRVEVFNTAGTTVSDLAVLTVTVPPPPPSIAPAITTQPASQTVTAGASASLAVVATGTPAPRYRWFRNGFPLEDAESATLTIASTKISDAGLYTVKVSNSAGSLMSAPAALTVNVIAGTITAGPQSQTVNAGSDVTFTVAATGTNLTYQWRFKGRAIKDKTEATLALTNAGTTSAGIYTVIVSSNGEVAGSASAMLTVTIDARLTNISTRGHVGDDDEVLISGFVLRGTGSKKVLLRAVGPTLGTQFNVPDSLANPRLTLFGWGRDGGVISSNNGWGGSAELAAAFAQVGAFALPATSADAALLATLDRGAYTSHITAPRGTSGVALTEVYDADTGTPTVEIANISTRALVGAEVEKTLIAGFAITGTTSDTVLIRGVGPSLGSLFGLRRFLGASHVAVYDSAGVLIAANTVWGIRDDDDRGGDTNSGSSSVSSSGPGGGRDDDEDDIDDACDRAGAWRLPRGSHDSALLLTLAPGVYTVHLTGVRRASGIGMVEIFEVR